MKCWFQQKRELLTCLHGVDHFACVDIEPHLFAIGSCVRGIELGDSVDGIEANSPLAITRALIRHRFGDIVPVVVERNGDQVTLQVEIRAFRDDG